MIDRILIATDNALVAVDNNKFVLSHIWIGLNNTLATLE